MSLSGRGMKLRTSSYGGFGPRWGKGAGFSARLMADLTVVMPNFVDSLIT